MANLVGTTVKLGSTIYTIINVYSIGYDLQGPRGGSSHLVQNLKRPELWGQNRSSGYQVKTTWYRRSDDGTFAVVR